MSLLINPRFASIKHVLYRFVDGYPPLHPQYGYLDRYMYRPMMKALYRQIENQSGHRAVWVEYKSRLYLGINDGEGVSPETQQGADTFLKLINDGKQNSTAMAKARDKMGDYIVDEDVYNGKNLILELSRESDKLKWRVAPITKQQVHNWIGLGTWKNALEALQGEVTYQSVGGINKAYQPWKPQKGR